MSDRLPTRRPRSGVLLATGALVTASLVGTPAPMLAQPPGASESATVSGALLVPRAPFERVGAFYVTDNLSDGEDARTTAASAEIVDITADATTLLYTDAYTGRVGFVDISDPASPQPLGELALPGSPTSAAIVGDHALVAVVTRTDPDGDGPLNEFDAPTGSLEVISLTDRSTVRSIDLAGQPDAVAISPDGTYAGVVTENERDEEENDGLIPQLPAGTLQVLGVTSAGEVCIATDNDGTDENLGETVFARLGPVDTIVGR